MQLHDFRKRLKKWGVSELEDSTQNLRADSSKGLTPSAVVAIVRLMAKPKTPKKPCEPYDGWTDETTYRNRFGKTVCRACHRGVLCPRHPDHVRGAARIERRKEAQAQYEASMRARDKCCESCEAMDEIEVRRDECSACGSSHALCMDCGLNSPPPCQQSRSGVGTPAQL